LYNIIVLLYRCLGCELRIVIFADSCLVLNSQVLSFLRFADIRMYSGIHWPEGPLNKDGSERTLLFEDLPLYVAARTAPFLSPMDSLSLIHSWNALSKEDDEYIWRPLMKSINAPKDLWPLGKKATRREWINALRRSRLKRFYVPNIEMTGSWLDDRRYWRRDELEQGSLFETVTRLNAVWWFNISGTWSSPAIGTFICAMRIKFVTPVGQGRHLSSVGSWRRTLKFIGSEDGSEDYSNSITDIPEDNFDTNQPGVRKDVWKYVYIGTLSVRSLPAIVQAGIFDHESTFKSGLTVDCCRFFSPGEIEETLGVSVEEFKERRFIDIPTISHYERAKQRAAVEAATRMEKEKKEEEIAKTMKAIETTTRMENEKEEEEIAKTKKEEENICSLM